MDEMNTTKDRGDGGGDERKPALTRPRNFCLNRETRSVLLEMQTNKNYKIHGIEGLAKRAHLTPDEVMGAISEAGQLGLIAAAPAWSRRRTMYGLTREGVLAIV